MFNTTPPVRQVIHIQASQAYDVIIQNDLLKTAGAEIKKLKPHSKIMIITDNQVGQYYLQPLVTQLTEANYKVCTYTFPHGESSKNERELLKIVGILAKEQLTRKDLILALGGGVVGDMAGFAAATYLRGIDYIQIPTSLLAAVDSSVGGKTAVNLEAGKNLWGAFKQPLAVLCDPTTLKTLPRHEFINGCGEIIKYGMLGYPELLEKLENTPLTENPELVNEVIATCVSIKAQIVEEDEKEKGIRQLLNFGHTFGHGIEKGSNYTISHGFAVAIGMSLMLQGAHQNNELAVDIVTRFQNILLAHKLPIQTDIPHEVIFAATYNDKKSKGKTINIILPIDWGYCKIKNMSFDNLKTYLN